MNLFLTIVSLIISIMALDNKKIKFVVELILTGVLATKTFILLFGDYTVWLDKDWTDKNIYMFFNGGQFYKCAVSFAITYGIFYWLIPNLLIKASSLFNLKRYSIDFFYKIHNGVDFKYKSAKQEKRFKWIINKMIKTTENIKNNPNIELDYNEIQKLYSVYLSMVLQLIVVWGIIMPHSPVATYIIYFLFAIITSLFITGRKVFYTYLQYIKKIKINENTSQKG